MLSGLSKSILKPSRAINTKPRVKTSLFPGIIPTVNCSNFHSKSLDFRRTSGLTNTKCHKKDANLLIYCPKRTFATDDDHSQLGLSTQPNIEKFLQEINWINLEEDVREQIRSLMIKRIKEEEVFFTTLESERKKEETDEEEEDLNEISFRQAKIRNLALGLKEKEIVLHPNMTPDEVVQAVTEGTTANVYGCIIGGGENGKHATIAVDSSFAIPLRKRLGFRIMDDIPGSLYVHGQKRKICTISFHLHPSQEIEPKLEYIGRLTNELEERRSLIDWEPMMAKEDDRRAELHRISHLEKGMEEEEEEDHPIAVMLSQPTLVGTPMHNPLDRLFATAAHMDFMQFHLPEKEYDRVMDPVIDHMSEYLDSLCDKYGVVVEETPEDAKWVEDRMEMLAGTEEVVNLEKNQRWLDLLDERPSPSYFLDEVMQDIQALWDK